MRGFVIHKFQILFGVCMVAGCLRADLSVSYQAFQPDDIVIEIGRLKMKAKELKQYGLEPVKATVTNSGTCVELFTPDRPYISNDIVCKKLKSSLITVGFTSLLTGYIGTILLIPITYFAFVGRPFRTKENESFGTYLNRLSCHLNKEYPRTVLLVCIVVPVALCSYVIRSVAIAHQYNQDLDAWCSKNLISVPVAIQPQQQITQLLFVDANRSKDIV